MNELLKAIKKELKTQDEIANGTSSKEKFVLPFRVIQLLEDTVEEIEKVRQGEIEKEIEEGTDLPL